MRREIKTMCIRFFEAGLQAWGEICAFSEAVDWLGRRSKADKQRLLDCTRELDEFLRAKEKVKMVGNEANPTMSFMLRGWTRIFSGSTWERGGYGKDGVFCGALLFRQSFGIAAACKV